MEISISRARTQLSSLIRHAEAGEEIFITRRGRPVARLTKVEAPAKQLRKLGPWKGRAWISEDFDAPLPDDLLDAFESPD